MKSPKKRKPSSLTDDLRAERPVLAGAATTLIFFTVGATWTDDLTQLGVTAGLFIWLFAVMIWCAFGVVRHAEVLAEYLGEPYGTLILTIAAVSIEVTIMATVMLSGDPNPTLPRDTVFAVLMIVLNGMIGLSVIVGALNHRQQQYNLQGAVAFPGGYYLPVRHLAGGADIHHIDGRPHNDDAAGDCVRSVDRAALWRLPDDRNRAPSRLLYGKERGQPHCRRGASA